MDGLGVGDLGRADDRRHIEITRMRWGRTDTYRLVGELHVLGLAIDVRMHRNRLDAEFAASTLDAQGNLKLTGRVKDLFKTSKGKYVSPAGIEALLALVPGVDAYCVVGIKFEPQAKRLTFRVQFFSTHSSSQYTFLNNHKIRLRNIFLIKINDL